MSVQSDVGRQSKAVMIIFIVACAALGYVAITWLTSGSKEPSSISAVQTNGHGVPTQETEHYSQVLNRYNEQKAKVAEKSGDSYVSVLSAETTHVPEAAQKQAPSSPSSPQQETAYYPTATYQNTQEDQQREKEVTDQTHGLMSNWASVSHGVARVSADGAGYTKSIMRVAEIVPSEPGTAVVQKVVNDFELVPAVLATDIDTDENSVVVANIHTGIYAGAKVFAMGYTRLTNTVDMTFTFMKWRGSAYKITAKAVDPTSMRTALSGEVNNRWFSRIVLPAIAMGIGRTGQLYEQASMQNIITPQGGVIQTYPSTPSGRAIAGTIIGGIGQQTGQVLANDIANTPVRQVVIKKGTTIGVQFIGPVLASAKVAEQESGADLSVLSQPALQPPRKNIAPPTATYPSNYPGGQKNQQIPPGNYTP